MKYKLKEVKPRIFLVNFDKKDTYDMSMLFLRYQEFYESPNIDFRGKHFLLLDFMEWYSHTYGNGVFTYPIDWAGFNFPGKIVDDVFNEGLGISDHNRYDTEMAIIYDKCHKKCPDGNFYIIGAACNEKVIKHEVAHGLFYTNSSYKTKMTKLVKNLKPSIRKKINKELKNMGYTPKVYIDETQAYLATGFASLDLPSTNKYEQFSKTFNSFYEK